MIKQISEQEVLDFVTDKRDLAFSSSTTYFGLYLNEVLVGVTGIVFMKSKVIFKNHYIPAELRGRGYFKTLLSWSMNYVLVAQDYKVIEATCTKMSIREYLKKGFTPIKHYKNYIKVRYENTP